MHDATQVGWFGEQVPYRCPMRLRVVGSVAVLATAIGSMPSLATVVSMDTKPRHRSSSVWLPNRNMAAEYRRVANNSDLFDLASPFWYDATSCSRLTGRPGAGSRAAIRGLVAKGLSVVPTVTATGLTPPAAIRCFSAGRRRAAHVERLAEVVTSRAYRGIDIDYESLALTTSPRLALKVQRSFTIFIDDLCRRMRRLHKVCVVTVMPRTSDELTVWRGKLIPGVYDYTAIAASASLMRVMAYDQHAPNTSPGPIAGFRWVRRVVAYAAGNAPLGKVELGVPTYGRDWSGGTADTLIGQQAVAIAHAHGVIPVFDPIQRELTYGYRADGVRHRVWFSSPAAVAARYQLARDTGMAGAAYWAAGLEQRGTWNAVRHR
jgi:spore germination protein YaaH